jgi:hypothetical protein
METGAMLAGSLSTRLLQAAQVRQKREWKDESWGYLQELCTGLEELSQELRGCLYSLWLPASNHDEFEEKLRQQYRHMSRLNCKLVDRRRVASAPGRRFHYAKKHT